MKFYDATVLKDAKSHEDRRFRNILANSGQIMESGEIRDIKSLYVMGRDGKPIAISSLDQDPDKQTEDYTVKAQADHGKIEDGELVDTIEKQFGSCKVWLEDDGLHARMYFANDDALADHAWAISEDASYSTGIDWYADGYYGVGLEIDEPIGILREISMVLTGNDPRAKTIDHKEAEAERAKGSESADAENGDLSTNKGVSEMNKVKDELTKDESGALKERLAGKIVDAVVDEVDEFTANVPESETQPTAADNKDEEGSEGGEEKKDTVTHNINVNVYRDRAVKQEHVAVKDNKAATKQAKKDAIRKALEGSQMRFDATFDRLYAENMRKVTKDDITGLPTPLNITNMFTSAMENSDGILSYIAHISGTNGRGLRNNVLAGDADPGLEAQGHKKGDTKVDEALTDTVRVAYAKMIYKKLSLDAMDIYNNPELLEYRASELLDQILLSIERGIFIGDGRSAPTGNDPDLRIFDSTTGEGLYPIVADAAAASGYGSLVASTYAVAAGGNLYDGVVGGRGEIRTEGEQILVVKPSVMTAAFQAKIDNRYLIEPGASAEDIFRVARVFSPMWMEAAGDVDAILLVRNGYTTVGERNPRVYPFFDVSTNKNILLNEMPIGGTLTKYKSAVTITGLSA